MRKSIRCLNPVCRNFAYARHKDFCPACRGEIALRYSSNKKRNGNQKNWIVILSEPFPEQSDYHLSIVLMYDDMKYVNRATFLTNISVAYLNAYFGYSSKLTSRKTFLGDNVEFWKSKFMGVKVMIMKKDGLDYIFGSPSEFNALKKHKFPIQKSKVSVERNPLPPGTLDEYDEQR